MPLQHQFEYFLRKEVPWKLRLSPSKQVAMDRKFYHFSDSVRRLVQRAPTEFEQFFEAFKAKFNEIQRWRAPRGMIVAHHLVEDENGNLITLRFPNGRPIHILRPRVVESYPEGD